MSDIAGRYAPIRKIGEGGMQEVFLARDQLLEREVALKRAKNSSAERRFKRSAVLSARVNHQNVAKTLDYVEEAGEAYLVEEYIEGVDLSVVLETGLTAIDPSLVAKVLHHVSRGVSASHAQGVIHRDLKPSNVMAVGGLALTCIKVTDFGIAKMAEEEIRDAVEGVGATLTTSKTVVGALPYMAPEAIETPRDVSFAADVWSIGAMGFELLYGQKPYGAGLAAVKRITAGSPPTFPTPISIKPQFGPSTAEVRAVIEACLKSDPKERPSSTELAVRCSGLCYATDSRLIGTVARLRYGAWGFIKQDSGPEVFFHVESVYGQAVNEGDRVLFSKYRGGGAWRAFPVIKLR